MKKRIIGLTVALVGVTMPFSAFAEELDTTEITAPTTEAEPLAEEIAAQSEPETVTPQGVYVLKQGVTEDVDISHSTPNSYWTQVDTTAQVTFKENNEGAIVVVNDKNHTSADVAIEEESFKTALNYAVTGDVEDDTYTWEYNKVILEGNGYHLDCIAYVPEYKVTFVTGDEKNVNVGVLRNDKVSAIEYTRDGYEFVGFFADDTFSSRYDFDTKVKSNFNIYLKWLEITPDPELEPDRPVVDWVDEDKTPDEEEPTPDTPETGAPDEDKTTKENNEPIVEESIPAAAPTIVKAADEEVPTSAMSVVPRTGDNQDIVMYILLAILAVEIIFCMLYWRKAR